MYICICYKYIFVKAHMLQVTLVMAYLNGNEVPDLLGVRTLVTKVFIDTKLIEPLASLNMPFWSLNGNICFFVFL